MDIVSPGKRQKLLRLALFIMAGCMFIYACVGFLFFPLWGKGMVETKLSQVLHRKVSIDAIYTNPFLLTLDIRGLVIEKADRGSDPFVSVERVLVDLSPRKVFTPALLVSRLEISAPKVFITRNPDQSFTFSDLISEHSDKKNKASKGLFPLVVSDIRLDKGQVIFTDHARSAVYELGNIDLRFWDVSTLPVTDEQGREKSAILMSGKAHVRNISLDHRELGNLVSIERVSMFLDQSDLLNLDICVRNLEMVSPEVHILRDEKRKFPLVSVFASPDRKGDTAISHSKEQKNSGKKDSDVSLRLEDVTITDGKFHFLDKALGLSVSVSPFRFHLGETKMSLGEKTLLFGPMEIQEGKVSLARNAQGKAETPQALFSKKEPERPNSVPEKGGSSSKKWQVSLASFVLDDYEVQFTDTAALEPVAVSLDQIHINTGEVNFTDTGKSHAEMDLKWNKKGMVAVKGDFGLHPLNAHLSLDLEECALPVLSPYLEELVRLRVTQGSLFTRGKVVVEADGSHSASLSYQGGLAVRDFTSIDKILSKKMFAWKNLDISGIQLTAFPVSLDIEKIFLDDFFSQAAISEQGRSNFGALLVEKEAKKGSSPARKKSEKAKAVQVEIGEICLKKGQIAFSDYFVSPHFQFGITQLAGSIKGISSRKDALAIMDIKAVHEQSSPIRLAGRLNPFSRNFFVDLKGSLSDVEMVRLTPYSGKYLGRALDQGKLAMDLEYEIKGSKLNSRNVLLMDRLALGKSVQSKDAVSLPLDLAISLLRNKKGVIDLNVPVSGDLSDPTFRLGNVIFRVLRNIIIKTATAPFSILGAMVGSGEELGYVEFSPGSSRISDAEKKKLEILARALKEKPSLRLEIKGTWSPGLDGRALKEIWFANHLKAMKLKAERNSGAASLDQITLSSQERSKYIEKAWEAKSFEDSSNETKKDEAEKQALLVGHAPVTDSELRSLGMERGTRIKEYLLSLDLIGEERLFLLEPGISDKKEEKQVRVDFSIR